MYYRQIYHSNDHTPIWFLIISYLIEILFIFCRYSVIHGDKLNSFLGCTILSGLVSSSAKFLLLCWPYRINSVVTYLLMTDTIHCLHSNEQRKPLDWYQIDNGMVYISTVWCLVGNWSQQAPTSVQLGQFCPRIISNLLTNGSMILNLGFSTIKCDRTG